MKEIESVIAFLLTGALLVVFVCISMLDYNNIHIILLNIFVTGGVLAIIIISFDLLLSGDLIKKEGEHETRNGTTTDKSSTNWKPYNEEY